MDGGGAGVVKVVGGLFTVRQRAAFLGALAEAGNVGFACAAAGVSKSRVYWARRREAEFAARWAAALVTARERLAAGGARDAGPTVVRRNCRGRLARRVARVGDWTEADDERFLCALIEHGNVIAAARAIRKHAASAYRRRWANSHFREAWEAALDDAVLGLQWALVARANAALCMPDGTGGAPVPGSKAPDAELALALVKAHAARRAGVAQRGGRRPRERDLAAVRDSVLEKLAAIERHRDDG